MKQYDTAQARKEFRPRFLTDLGLVRQLGLQAKAGKKSDED
jgi:hypothetical protein